MNIESNGHWFSLTHDEKCDLIETVFKDNSYRDEISPAEIDQLGKVAMDVTKRRVSNVWEIVQSKVESMARGRAETKGITYPQALEEIIEILKKDGKN